MNLYDVVMSISHYPVYGASRYSAIGRRSRLRKIPPASLMRGLAA
jgi:hypothetical protein